MAGPRPTGGLSRSSRSENGTVSFVTPLSNRLPRRRAGRAARWLACVLALAATGACRPGGPQRVVVSGTVTYRGEPLREGKIRFFPTKGTDTPMAGAHIVDGQYRVDQRGGVPVGTHKVMIEAYRPLRGAGPAPELPPGDIGAGLVPQEQYLPEKYNVNTELEVTLEPGTRRTIDFELTD